MTNEPKAPQRHTRLPVRWEMRLSSGRFIAIDGVLIASDPLTGDDVEELRQARPVLADMAAIDDLGKNRPAFGIVEMTVKEYLADPSAATETADRVGAVVVINDRGERQMTISGVGRRGVGQ